MHRPALWIWSKHEYKHAQKLNLKCHVYQFSFPFWQLYAWKLEILTVILNQSRDKDSDVPDAGQPVCSQPKNTHQQNQNSCPVLDVVIQFTGDPTQTEKPDNLKWAEETADPLKQE